ncbi:MAG: DUF2845 domain-containing protein [Pseudomonadota bacterium]
MKPDVFAARAVVCAAALWCLAPSAWAFKCNSNVIDVGLHKMEVLKKCGAPALKDSRIERRTVRLRNGGALAGGAVEVEREQQVTIEEWVYNFGPSQFMQLLVIENGLVTDVRDLGYGS